VLRNCAASPRGGWVTENAALCRTYGVDLLESPKGWRISRLVFRLKFIDGNADLESS